MAWAKSGTHTLTSAADLIDGTIETATQCFQFLSHTIEVGGITTLLYQFDGTDQVSLRYNQNGGTDATAVSTATPVQLWVGYGDRFIVNYYENVTGEEKLGIVFEIDTSSTGAGTAPARMESIIKSVQSAQITRVRVSNSVAGSYDIGSDLSILGTD